MNKLPVYLIGAAIGAGVGYFIGSVAVEIIAIKNHDWENYEYEDLDEDPGNDDETNLEPKTKDVKRPLAMSKKRRVKNYSEYFENQGKPELAALVRKYNSEEATVVDALAREEEEYEGLRDPIDEDDDIPSDPSIISMEEYANAEGYETLTLEYFDDGIVIDEHKNVIPRHEDILGDEFDSSFGHMSHDSDVVYVKNEAKKAMYEVVRVNLEYAPEPRQKRRDRIDKRGEENAEEDNT